MSKERKFAQFLVERLQTSKENKTLYEAICHNFMEIVLDNKRPNQYIVAVHNNEEKLFKISHRIDDDTLMATQTEEKKSTLNPYRLSITGNNIRFATLEDLIKYKAI